MPRRAKKLKESTPKDDPYVNVPAGVELRLAGDSGTSGQLLTSGGPGTNPLWADPLTAKEIVEAVQYGKTPPAGNMFLNDLIPLPTLPYGTRSYGSMVLWKDRFLFILCGNSATSFWCYDIELGAVRTLGYTPYAIADGSLVGVHADRYLYTCRGGGTTEFYRYDILTDTWASMAAIPATVTDAGGGSAYDGSLHVYLLRGGLSTDFYRYDCDANSWVALTSIPIATNYPSNLVKANDYLYVLIGDNTTGFYRYDIAAGTWAAMAAAPLMTLGGALAWDGGDYVYALRGGTYRQFWRYKIPTDTWETLTLTPDTTSQGGLSHYKLALGDVIFTRQGQGTGNWWMYKV